MSDPYVEELEKKFTDPELRKRVLRVRASIVMASDIVSALSASFDDVLRMDPVAWAEKMSDEISTASDFFQRLEISMLGDRKFLAKWGREGRWSAIDALTPPEPPKPEMIPPPEQSTGTSVPMSRIANLFEKG